MNLLTEGITIGAVIKTDRATKLTVDGLTDTYVIYQVRLDYLYFNDQNDRIATWISQYKAENGITSISMEDVDKYNDIIQGFITKSNPDKLKQTEKNIELIGQQKYGVVITDGRIIDGNRRFSCLRNLSKKSNKFNYFETVILKRDYEHNAKQIKMLELQVQIGEEARVDYNPIDRLVGVYRDLVKDLNGPLVELYGILNKIKDEDKRQEVKYIVFTNFLMAPSGDMTRFVRNLKKVTSSNYLDEFIEKETNISEEVLDGLPEIGKVTPDTIAKVRANKDIVEQLGNEMEIVSNKVKVSEVRNKPGQILTKAVDSILSIDLVIINKLTNEQREEIAETIERLEGAIADIKEVL